MSEFYTFMLDDLENMFYDCKSLTYLDISQLFINETPNLNEIFTGVISNITVIISDDINPALKEEISNLNIKNITEDN